MDTRERQLRALGNYIKSRRARLQPGSLGLAHDPGRRRTPGLRREEVAQLAGVSMTWYTWLEQGRDIHVSKDVLDSIARALQLNTDEHLHMLQLADASPTAPLPGGFAEPEPVSPALRSIVLGLPYPALAVDPRAYVHAWNDAASRYFIDFASLPDAERNMTRLLCTNASLRSRIANWETCAEYAIAMARSYHDRHPGDLAFLRFVEELKLASPFFNEQWERHEIRRKSTVLIEFLNGDGDGTAERYEITAFSQSSGMEDLSLLVCTPCPAEKKGDS